MHCSDHLDPEVKNTKVQGFYTALQKQYTIIGLKKGKDKRVC